MFGIFLYLLNLSTQSINSSILIILGHLVLYMPLISLQSPCYIQDTWTFICCTWTWTVCLHLVLYSLGTIWLYTALEPQKKRDKDQTIIPITWYDTCNCLIASSPRSYYPWSFSGAATAHQTLPAEWPTWSNSSSYFISHSIPTLS